MSGKWKYFSRGSGVYRINVKDSGNRVEHSIRSVENWLESAWDGSGFTTEFFDGAKQIKNPFKDTQPGAEKYKHLACPLVGEYRVKAWAGDDAPAEYRYASNTTWIPSSLGKTWKTLTTSQIADRPPSAIWDGYIRDQDGNVIE